jgi:hypothetical protein
VGGAGMVRHYVCSFFCGLTVVRGHFSRVEDWGGMSME